MARGFFQKYRVNSTHDVYTMWHTQDANTRDSNVIFNTKNNAIVKLPNVYEADRGCVVTVFTKGGVATKVQGSNIPVDYQVEFGDDSTTVGQFTLTGRSEFVDYFGSIYYRDSSTSVTLMYIHEESKWLIVNNYNGNL